ncbi:MAG: ERCC4 domain-containing protein [Candidatus Micrarchaeota archaeon]
MVKSGGKIEKKAKIVIDRRESIEYDKWLKEFGLNTSRKTLSIGDFVLSSRLVAERKTRQDFESSIIDGRLFEQAKRLTSAYPRTILIIEGPPPEEERISRPALLGAYSALISEYGISLFFCKNPKSTAELLSSMAKYEQISKKTPHRIRSRQKSLTLSQAQRALIESLPSCGPRLAHNLLRYFNTPLNIFKADEKALEKVPLLGKKKAKLIRKVLDSVYKWKEE